MVTTRAKANRDADPHADADADADPDTDTDADADSDPDADADAAADPNADAESGPKRRRGQSATSTLLCDGEAWVPMMLPLFCLVTAV